MLSFLPVTRRIVEPEIHGVKANRAPLRRLFVDISTIARHDAGTGIQRVVRSVCREMSRESLPFDIRGVVATKWRPFSEFPSPLLPPCGRDVESGRLRLGDGDAFLGLDLSTHLFARHEGQLSRWRAAGAQIAVVVYDLLPFAHPEWFSPKNAAHFRRWLDVVACQADLVLPISTSVKGELAEYLRARWPDRAQDIRSEVLPLTGDIGRFPGEHSRSDRVVDSMCSRPSVLMVGTIEPRKGHAAALAAHRVAWEQSPETAPLLIIAGRSGWHTETLQSELRALDVRHHGVIWLEDVSDVRLDDLYRACSCVLVASYGEGYCLPLHEALAYGKPVLARDLPVLREANDPRISYFNSDDPVLLAAALARTCSMIPAEPPNIGGGKRRGWDRTVRTIIQSLGATDPPSEPR